MEGESLFEIMSEQEIKLRLYKFVSFEVVPGMGYLDQGRFLQEYTGGGDGLSVCFTCYDYFLLEVEMDESSYFFCYD